jgi:hypothetical protein
MQLTISRILLLTLFIALTSSGLAQTIQISDNKKLEYQKNYPPKENLHDTTYIVLDFERELLDIRKEVQDIGDYKMNYIVFTMSYSLPTPSNNWVYFFHMASPPFGHEEYSVNKNSISKDKLLVESDKSSLFWYQNYLVIREGIVILIDLKDWDSDYDWIKGIGITVSTNTIE